MNRFPPYASYKSIGLPWLTTIPSHWGIRRGKYLFNCIDIRSATGEEELLTVSSERGIIPRKSANVTMFKAESYVGYKLCWPGDLVINSLWAWARGLGVSNYHGIISSAYGVYRLKPEFQDYSRFIHKLVRSVPFQWELQVRSKGIWISRLQLTDESFLEIPFPFPPPQEQTAIVRYLNYMDRRINRYIKAKKKLIGLLNEQKQAIIHKLVALGLDPNVRLKPSGIEWLGDIPEHWELISLRYLSTRFGSGVTPRGGATIYQSVGVPFLRSQNIHFDGLRLNNVVLIPRDLHEQLQATHVHPGDVLLNITGASIGRVCHVPNSFTEGNVNQHVCIIRPRVKRVLPEFLAAFMSIPSIQQEINIEQNGASRQGLALDAIKALKILLPSLEEQQNILNEIPKHLHPLNDAIKCAENDISLLSEYHSRLIADVVTGKIDVSEIATNLPDEMEEDELVPINDDDETEEQDLLADEPTELS